MAYLPHILRHIVEEVNKKMQERENGFEVFFESGLYQTISRKIYQEKDNGKEIFPLFWLKMPFYTGRHRQNNGLPITSCEIMILVQSRPDLSQDEWEDEVLTPYLLPLQDSFLEQLRKDKRIQQPTGELIDAEKGLIPYWGGDETGNNNVANISKFFVSAVHLRDLRLSVRNIIC